MKSPSIMAYMATATALLPLASADWQFKSRTDLAPPRLNITIPATSDVEQGYLFVAPFSGLPSNAGGGSHGPRQEGPYIFRDDGELVWSGYGYYSIWAANFQAAQWKGQDVLFSFEGDHNPAYGHGHGHVTFLDQHYETVRELRAGNHKLMDKHEFHIIDERTGLIQVYQPVPVDLTQWGGSTEQQWIVDAIIQELDIETGELLFEWSSLEHVSPDEAVIPLNPGQAGAGYNSSDAWDYFHINSVDKDSNGDYLISARDACAVHKINGTTGEIIWRLGGKRSDFDLGPNVSFCFQHHARFLSQSDDEEIISLFDNAAHGTENGHGSELHTNPFSQGKIINVNTASWTASIVQAFQPPDGLLAKSQGSTQILPNGNALVNWGSEGAMTEFTPDGTAVFHAYMDSDFLGEGVQNYRAFRANWTGLPHEQPALAVRYDARSGSTTAYVSWNGDTETAVWRFFAVTDHHGSRRYLGQSQRTGFETGFAIPRAGHGSALGQEFVGIAAEAISSTGRILRSTAVSAVQQDVVPPVSLGHHAMGRYGNLQRIFNLARPGQV